MTARAPRTAARNRHPRRLWGGHVSVAKGLEHAPQRGASCGLAAIQIFTRNQNRWDAPPVGPDEGRAFRAERHRWRIAMVASHGSYLVNLASPDAALRQRSVEQMVIELTRCRALGIDQLIFHPGAHMGDGEAVGIARIAQALDQVLELDGQRCVQPASQQPPRLLLETTAGQGTQLGWRFAHLRDILAACRSTERLAVCLDTAHVFAAGYDLRTLGGYESMFAELDAAVGLSQLQAFHVNDSKVALGTRVDRHEALGHGHIGVTAFHRLGKDPRWKRTPLYMETPGGELHYRENLSVLRGESSSSRSAGSRRGAASSSGGRSASRKTSSSARASSRSSSAARRRRRT